MNRVLHLFALLLISVNLFAQAPQKMSYQAVIRNASNNLISNAPVRMKISILQGSASGTAVYSEQHNPTTNANGLVSIEIGAGTSQTGTFSSINWGSGTYFIKTETDPANGTNYSIVGTSQLLSVPYALFSGNGLPSNGGQNQTLSFCNGDPTWGPCIPKLITNEPTNFSSNSAVSGGNISTDAGNPVTSRGVVWSINPQPTIVLSSKTSNGTGVGTFTSNITGLTRLTKYYVRAYATNSAGTSYGNEFSFITKADLPIITTTSISSISMSSAISGGSITNDGGAPITNRGVVWSTSNNPTIALTTKTNNGTGIGFFTSSLTGLTANTTYYVRAYATNNSGTAYGNELTFKTNPSDSVTDIDGKKYEVKQICNQVWMTQNLDVSRYRNGDIIPQIQDQSQWANLTTGAWCYYANSSTDGPKFGKLYNWYAINDPRGLAPEGFHIPNDAEWDQLINCLGGVSVAGGKMKAVSGLWRFPNTGATNSSGFNAFPYGVRYNDGNFGPSGFGTDWWSSSNTAVLYAPIINLSYDSEGVVKRILDKKFGIYVRCVKD